MKKIIAVILTVSFLAVTPAQAAGPDRPTQATGPERPTQAATPDRPFVAIYSPGGGIWCCLVEM